MSLSKGAGLSFEFNVSEFRVHNNCAEFVWKKASRCWMFFLTELIGPDSDLDYN